MQRKQFSHLGLSLCVYFVLTAALQWCIPIVCSQWFDVTSNVWVYFSVMYLPGYLLAAPYAYILMRMRTVGVPPRRNIAPLKLLSCLPVCFAAMYAGNFLGNIVNTVITLCTGRAPDNTIAALVDYASPLPMLVFVVILGPIVEEVIFRKGLIDLLYPFGEKVAVIFSAVLFAALHGNFYQFFYAAGVGAVLALLYCRTGKLRYTIFLHSLFNLLGSIVSPWVLSISEDLSAGSTLSLIVGLMGMLFSILYSGAMIALLVLGIVLIVRTRKSFRFRPGIPLQSKTVTFCNVGIIFLSAISLTLFILNI
ncbi:MAG: CPBP family intramembrane metalloprotease [Clostridia bacterium]|nr:CPBP family intramembrane metalloprotease [Clostridia bacterium]